LGENQQKIYFAVIENLLCSDRKCALKQEKRKKLKKPLRLNKRNIWQD
jgi:hypothetical protein